MVCVSVRAVSRELFDELRQRLAELRNERSWSVCEEIAARIDELEEALSEEANAMYIAGVNEERERRRLPGEGA